MITVYPVLRQQMRTHGVTSRELAAVADISLWEFYLKMCGIKRWNLAEAVRICCFFRTPGVEHLFVRNHSKSQLLESQGKL